MTTASTRIATATSVLIRLGAYFFLRWALFPPVPSILFALLPVNVAAFVVSLRTESPYELVEAVDVVVTDTVVTDAADGGVVAEKEEVDVTDTLAVQRKRWRPVRTLLLGAPSPSWLLSWLAVLANGLLVAFVADRLYTEHAITADGLSFVRLGYVSDAEAKFLVREPDAARMPVTLELRLQDAQAPFDSPVWQTAGGVRWTDNGSDFTAVLSVPLRHPNQRRYEWRTSNGHAGSFTAAPRAGHAPTLHNGSYTFVATSCMVSRVPYSPLDHPLAIPGARHLARVLPRLGAQFVLFLGDFIYVDVPRRWGAAVADYRQKYRQVYASPDWPPMAQNVSWIHVLDDHEIANDWSAQQTGVYAAAADPWKHYHAAANPPPAAAAAGVAAGGGGASYFSFVQGPASFFLLDTRTYRSSNALPATSANKTMLGAAQRAAFLAWLRRPEPRGVRWKVVASSVPFTKNWRVNTRDTWGGFLAERRVLLEAMWDAGAARGTGVVILSGDRHEFAATRFPPPAAEASRWPARVAVHEFSASPLSQFYSPVPSYFQRDGEDVPLRYIHRGNSKFGAVTILPPAEDAAATSRLEYRLYVDGQEAWNTTITAPEAVGGAAPTSFWGRLLG